MFSHRLLAFPQADLVVVLDRGRILEQGTHAELSAREWTVRPHLPGAASGQHGQRDAGGPR